jgi:peptidoglycan/LPS O-acetylase OafA/YrhL
MKADSSNLDFLRTNAVLLVLGFHLALFFGTLQLGTFSLRPLGELGVLLFFVHTSLVLMLSLERQQKAFQKGTLFPVFMLRRVFRIYPLSVLIVLIVFLFRLPMIGLVPGHFETGHLTAFGVASNLLLVQNITEVPSILGPLWSLPYEVQMYLFLPPLFLLAGRIRSVRPLFLLWAASLAIALVHARFGHMPDLVRFMPCFLPGIIAYKLLVLRRPAQENAPSASSSVRSRLQLPFFVWPLFLLGICWTYVLEQGKEHGWLICLVVGAAIPYFAEMQNPWLRRASQLIARYSYSIYLAHYLCMWLAFVVSAGLPRAAQWGIFMIALPGGCLILYHGLEAPMISFGHRLAKRLFRASQQPVQEIGVAADAAADSTAAG